MSYAGYAAHAAAAINALKALGPIVQVDPDTFQRLVGQAEQPLVVVGRGGFLNRKHKYLLPHRGLFFYCLSLEPLPLGGRVDVIAAKKIWVPSAT